MGKPVEIPDFPLGGSRSDDDPFRINQTIVKSYPSQIHTQAPIGLDLELGKEVALADIKSIHIDTYHTAASSASSEPEKWDPKTRETALRGAAQKNQVGMLLQKGEALFWGF